jgi:hypothetical protein
MTPVRHKRSYSSIWRSPIELPKAVSALPAMLSFSGSLGALVTHKFGLTRIQP